MRLLKLFFLAVCAAALSGCFETEFNFKTAIKPDGSVIRNTSLDGRGAYLFKAPNESGWQSKSWETKGENALIPLSEHHIRLEGRFTAGQEILPDYQFDIPKISESWSEKDTKKLEEAGIKPPFDRNVFSRNQVRIHRIQGLLTTTTIYEEIFQNANVIPVLMLDLKEEIRKQSESKGQNFQDSELEDLARLRLEEEILPQIRFKSEVELPGEVSSTNGKQDGKNKVTWQFTMRDFQAGYSIYTLRATSRMFRPAAVLFFASAAFLVLFMSVLILVGMSRFRSAPYDSKPKKKAPKKTQE